MIAAEIAARIPGARNCGAGFRGPALCHGSVSLTVSIADGDKCVLLYCHRGCSFAKIASAYNVGLSDLFYERKASNMRGFRSKVAPSQDEVERELREEATRYRARKKVGDGEMLVASDLNASRRSASARLGIALQPVPLLAADSHTGAHERDPLWALLLERAWDESWVAFDGRRACCGVDNFAAHGIFGIQLLDIAERAAAAELKRIGRRGIARAAAAAEDTTHHDEDVAS